MDTTIVRIAVYIFASAYFYARNKSKIKVKMQEYLMFFSVMVIFFEILLEQVNTMPFGIPHSISIAILLMTYTLNPVDRAIKKAKKLQKKQGTTKRGNKKAEIKVLTLDTPKKRTTKRKKTAKPRTKTA